VLTGTWAEYSLPDAPINVFCAKDGFVGVTYYNAGLPNFKTSLNYGATFGAATVGTLTGCSKTGSDYAYRDLESRTHIIKSGVEVYVKVINNIIGFNADLTKIITFDIGTGIFTAITPDLTTGYINKVISTIHAEPAPEIGRVTTSILCGDADKIKKFLKIRVFNEKEQNFSLTFIDPVMPTVQGNNSYGVNFAARRLVMQISPEEPGATINQISLTYDLLSADIKRGG
jgi:hypothetical protein